MLLRLAKEGEKSVNELLEPNNHQAVVGHKFQSLIVWGTSP